MKQELICFLYNKKMVEDLAIEVPDIEAMLTIETEDISYVRERAEEMEIDEKNSMVGLKSGDSFLVKKSYKKMLELWK